MNKVAIMQPYFLPYIGYWQLINSVDIFVIYDDVNYIKKGYINRNSILISGKPYLFTLPLNQSSQNLLINELDIYTNSLKILKTIQYAYSKAPYFTSVYPLLKSIFEFSERNLAKFIANSIEMILNYLSIKTDLVYSSKIPKDNKLRAEEKIIDICKCLKATHYVNASGGRELYLTNNFEKNNIKLNFLSNLKIRYQQFDNSFVPNLSIIDVMMFNSPTKILNMLKSEKAL